MENDLRTHYNSIDEAFNALPEFQKAHSKRVAEYAQIIYLQAVAEDIYPQDVKTNARLKEEYRGLAYLCGLYHDIGKVLVPENYHIPSSHFSPEEVALYRKHAADSAELVEKYLKPSKEIKALEIRILLEAVASHHENWDGSGFPSGASGISIPVMARIIAVADALDHTAMQKLSEHPLEDAEEIIENLAGSAFDPEVIKLLKQARAKLKRVFTANISGSRAIPSTETFIRRGQNRAARLVFRPVVSRRGGKIFAYEAKMEFKDREGWLDYSSVENIVKQNKFLDNLGIYFLLEACDTINRFKACSIEGAYIALELPTGWLNRRGAYKDVISAVSDEMVPPEKLVITISNETWKTRTKTLGENLSKLRENGIGVMFSGIIPSKMEDGEKLATDFRIESVNADYLEDTAECEIIKQMKASGIRLIADGIGKKNMQTPLNKLAVTYATGPMAGDFMEEDVLVSNELASRG